MISDNMNPIGSVLKKLLEIYGFDRKMKEKDILEAWPQVVGKVFNKYTTSLEVKYGTLYVKMSSPAAKNELNNNKAEIKAKINEMAGEILVKDIVIR